MVAIAIERSNISSERELDRGTKNSSRVGGGFGSFLWAGAGDHGECVCAAGADSGWLLAGGLQEKIRGVSGKKTEEKKRRQRQSLQFALVAARSP